MMSPWILVVIAMAASVSGRGVAAAQVAGQPDGAKAKPAPLRRVEGGVGDVDPLGLSFRQLSVDLRQPVGFAGVYQVPASRSPTGRAAFARMSGATTAVFDQSTYLNTPDGPLAAIPAGTVFYIGGLPEQRPSGARGGDAGTAVSTAVDMRAVVVADMTAPTSKVQTLSVSGDPGAPQPSIPSPADRVAVQWPEDPSARAGEAVADPVADSGILGDEAYRGARVTQLLRRAAELVAPSTPAK